jgi:hypothetical protein
MAGRTRTPGSWRGFVGPHSDASLVTTWLVGSERTAEHPHPPTGLTSNAATPAAVTAG